MEIIDILSSVVPHEARLLSHPNTKGFVKLYYDDASLMAKCCNKPCQQALVNT